MLSYKKWLYKPIDYETDYYIKDALDVMINRILIWIENNPEISLSYNTDSFKKNFYHYMYNKYKDELRRK